MSIDGEPKRGLSESARIKRRVAIAGGISALLTLYTLPHVIFPTLDQGGRPEKLGTTFSIKQCDDLGLDERERGEALKEIVQLQPDVLRLCAYWNRIQPSSDKFDPSYLDRELEVVGRYPIEVAVALGAAKSPRWPEFFLPNWIKEKYGVSLNRTDAPIDQGTDLDRYSTEYLSRLVEHLKIYPQINMLQVENEQFNRVSVAADRTLSSRFVESEVSAVKEVKRADQRILATASTLWWPMSAGEDEAVVEKSLKFEPDALGLNVYTKVGVQGLSLQPTVILWRKLRRLASQIINSRTDPWITEAQAEPWEHGKLVALDQRSFPSASPESTRELVSTLANLGYGVVLLWGGEYWYAHNKKYGGREWLNPMGKLFAATA